MKIYKLGEGCHRLPDGRLLSSWPYRVAYVPERKGDVFLLEEGDARNGNGGFFRAADALKPEWRAHLETAGVLWLVPLLERMARGEPVPTAEVLIAYTQVHGKPPIGEETRVY